MRTTRVLRSLRVLSDVHAGGTGRAGRVVRAVGAGLLVLGAAASPAVADSSPSASPSDDGAGPTSAGTSFRTATEVDQGQQATASASMGDYLYWSFPRMPGSGPP